MTNHIIGAEADGTSPMSRRALLTGATALAVAAHLGGPRPARADGYKFGISMGWSGGESGRHFQYGYADSLAKLGGTATVTDAGWDPRKQVTQIDQMVASSVDAILLTSSSAAGIAPAVQRALAAGIPVFGYYSATWMAKKLGGKGKVATVSLPQNETWDERTLGMKFAFSRYPEIAIVSNWSFALAGGVTPDQAVASMLAQHPDLDAIWCAWDGAGVAGADEAKKAGRNNVIFTSIDGGSQTFTYLKSGTGLKLSMAQSFYEMAYLNVFYAHQLLAGQKVPRLVVTPVYAVTSDMLTKEAMTVYDTYDQPGADQTLGWSRVL
jgi:ribose transport system substrate-binding protein